MPKKQHIRLRMALDDFRGILKDRQEIAIIEGEGVVRIQRPATISLVLYERDENPKEEKENE